jgi:allophanate hydrolase subunit 2
MSEIASRGAPDEPIHRVRMLPCGDRATLVKLPPDVGVLAFRAGVAALRLRGVGELVPAARTLLVHHAAARGPVVRAALVTLLPEAGRDTDDGADPGRGSLRRRGPRRLIRLGPDAPVTGRYPVIAVVPSNDLDAAGQLRPGDEVRFHVW